MTVIFPNNHQPERLYVVKILLGIILGLHFQVEFEKRNNTEIKLRNGRSIVVGDHFFCNFPLGIEYLKASSIPSEIIWATKSTIPFLTEKDLPILFGNDSLKVTDKSIKIGIDVFAASFFCLTRWEEAGNTTRDIHGRFPAEASLAVKSGYLQRPIVDEMAGLLRNIFTHLGESMSFSSNRFELFITHDIDSLCLWPSWGNFLKKTAGDLLKRYDLATAVFNFQSFFGHKFKGHPDPYNTFDYLMDVSEHHGLTSHFYFLAGGNSKFDNGMEQNLAKAKPIIEHIHERGHIIGVHPSYCSTDDEEVFGREIERFRLISPQAVTQGRQHFLRFEVGKTWQLWEKNGLEMDSTLAYPEQSGFRCGTCTPFPVFDVFEKRQLALIESPLTAMDATYPVYQKCSASDMERDLLKLLATVKKYNGRFTFLWHNTSFHVPEYQPFAAVYERFLAAAKTAS